MLNIYIRKEEIFQLKHIIYVNIKLGKYRLNKLKMFMGGMIKIRSEINRTKKKKTMRKLVKPKVGSLVINNIVELIIRLTSKTNKQQQKIKQWEKENTLEISEMKDIIPDLRYWKVNKRILWTTYTNILDNLNDIDEFLKSTSYKNIFK